MNPARRHSRNQVESAQRGEMQFQFLSTSFPAITKFREERGRGRESERQESPLAKRMQSCAVHLLHAGHVPTTSDFGSTDAPFDKTGEDVRPLTRHRGAGVQLSSTNGLKPGAGLLRPEFLYCLQVDMSQRCPRCFQLMPSLRLRKRSS